MTVRFINVDIFNVLIIFSSTCDCSFHNFDRLSSLRPPAADPGGLIGLKTPPGHGGGGYEILR